MNMRERIPQMSHQESASPARPVIDAHAFLEHQLEKNYLQDVDQILQTLELDETTTKRIRDLLSHPWIKTEVLAHAAGKNSSQEKLQQVLVKVLENIDAVTAQFNARQKTAKQLNKERAILSEQQSSLSTMTDTDPEQTMRIQKNIQSIDEQLQALPYGLFEMFQEIPGSSISAADVRNAEHHEDEDEDLDIDSSDADTTPVTPTYKVLAQQGIKPPSSTREPLRERDESIAKPLGSSTENESQTIFVDPQDLDVE